MEELGFELRQFTSVCRVFPPVYFENFLKKLTLPSLGVCVYVCVYLCVRSEGSLKELVLSFYLVSAGD